MFRICLLPGISVSSECIIALQRTCTLVVGLVYALNESESVKWSGGKYLSRDYGDHFSANERPAPGHTDQCEGVSVTRGGSNHQSVSEDLKKRASVF